MFTKTHRDAQLQTLEYQIVEVGRVLKSRSWGGCTLMAFAEAEREYDNLIRRRQELQEITIIE